MRNKRMWFLCMTFVSLLMFPMLMLAQVDLTETYTSPDRPLTINYPAGYTVNETDTDRFRITGGAGTLNITFYDNNGSGYAPVTALELLEVAVGEDEEMRGMLEYSEPEEVIVAGYRAYQSTSPMMNEFHVLIDFGDGVLGKALGFATNLGTSEPVFMAMLNSIQYGDGPPPPIVYGPLDNIVAINSANASQVAQLLTVGDADVAVESVAFSVDERLLAYGTADGDVILWDVATSETRFTFPGHRGGAASLAFGAGGYQLAVGAGNGQVWMWDPNRGELSRAIQRHDDAVTSVAFQPEDFLIASGGADGSIRMWDMSSASERSPLSEPDAATPIGSLAFSPDETLLAAGGGSRIRVWDAASGTITAELETEISDISSIRFSPDGTALIYGGADPAVWLWDMADSNQVLLDGHVGTVVALVFSPDGSVIASADAESVRLWDAATGASLATLASPSNSLAFNPDGTILISGGASGGVVLWGTSVEGDAAQVPSAPETPTGDTAAETTTTTASCTINVQNTVNLRGGPGTTFDRAGALSAGQTVEVNGQTQGADGMTWYRLATGEWVRSDVVGSPAACANVPAVTG